MTSALDRFVVPDSRRIWVVRSDEGVFYDHFLSSQCAAIGHLDQHIPPRSTLLPTDDELIESIYAEARRRGETRRWASIRFNQARRFIHEMSIGDWIVTVDSFRFTVGRIKSDAYVSNEPVLVRADDAPEATEMRFRLRREVNWGPRLRRYDLPVAVARSIKSNLTVFNIDAHWKAIHHLALPFFIKGEKTYLSVWIDQKESISSIDIASIIDYFTDFEIIAREIENVDLDQDFNFRKSRVLRGELESNLGVQAQIMSPGPLWLAATLSVVNIPVLVYFYVMIFGGKTFQLETDGLVDKETRQKLYAYFGRAWTESIGPMIANRLKLRTPSEDGGKLLPPHEKEED